MQDKNSDMKKERLTPFDRFRERHEHIDNLCSWLEDHWEDVVLYVLGTVILVLIVIFVLIMCSACSGLSTIHN